MAYATIKTFFVWLPTNKRWMAVKGNPDHESRYWMRAMIEGQSLFSSLDDIREAIGPNATIERYRVNCYVLEGESR